MLFWGPREVRIISLYIHFCAKGNRTLMTRVVWAHDINWVVKGRSGLHVIELKSMSTMPDHGGAVFILTITLKASSNVSSEPPPPPAEKSTPECTNSVQDQQSGGDNRVSDRKSGVCTRGAPGNLFKSQDLHSAPRTSDHINAHFPCLPGASAFTPVAGWLFRMPSGPDAPG